MAFGMEFGMVRNEFGLVRIVNPFTFFWGGAAAFFEVNFLENYTSNEVQTKLKKSSKS